jgi:hypothetical protein
METAPTILLVYFPDLLKSFPDASKTKVFTTLGFTLAIAHPHNNHAEKEQPNTEAEQGNCKLGTPAIQKQQQDAGDKDNIEGHVKAGLTDSAIHIDLYQ